MSRTAIITGASRGIGAAVAERLSKDGFSVVVNYAGQEAEASAVTDKINAAGARAITVKADVSPAEVIVVTGASSGFGALAARALAKAGHTVYASMRGTSGRNKRQVEEVGKFAAENKVDLRTVELDVLSEASANAAIQKTAITIVETLFDTI